jgi:hypothetical protein
MPRLASTAAALLILLLGACGGGEDSGDRSGRYGSGATSGEGATGEGATGGVATTGPGGDGKTNDGDTLELDPDANRQPVPKGSVPPDDRTGKPPRYTRKNPLSKQQLKAIERPIYEQSRYLCKRLGVEGMRREYRLQSSDPEEVARAVAERTYQREARDAVYSGCLAGLRSGD